MIAKVTFDHTRLYDVGPEVQWETVSVRTTDVQDDDGHIPAVLRWLDIDWDALHRLHMAADEAREVDWTVTGPPEHNGEQGWTYRVIWWRDNEDRLHMVATTGAVYIMTESGQTVEALN